MKVFNLFESLDKGLDEPISHAEGKKVFRTKKIKFKVCPDHSTKKNTSLKRK